jgi:hypothetical protein
LLIQSEKIKLDKKMNEKSEINISYALLATQNALLGIVTPELRSVCINLDVEEKNNFDCHQFSYIF